MTKPVELNFRLRDRAAARYLAEGGHALRGLALQWPCIPTRGDLLRFDWMLDDEELLVVAREFQANADMSVSVTLHLDLADQEGTQGAPNF